MKKITDAIKRLQHNQINELKALFKIKKSIDNDSREIIFRLLSYSGINLVLSQLNDDELKILNAAYNNENGITFGEIEKSQKINILKIEEISNCLSKKLLIYVLKNRGKLHNKLDKIHMISEIRDVLNPLEVESISHHLKKIINKLEEKNYTIDESHELPLKDKHMQQLLELIFNCGGIIVFEKVQNIIPYQHIEKILTNLIQKNIIHICQYLKFPSKSFLILNENIFIYLINKIHLQSIDKSKNIHNHYNFLLNIITTYDTVSTYGLFLTKQKEFRKIDSKRLEESMFNIFNIDNIEINRNELYKLSLFALDALQELKIKRDSVIISLKKIGNYLNDPLNLLNNFIKTLPGKVENLLFNPPFRMPSYSTIIRILELVYQYEKSSYIYLQSAYLLEPLSGLNKEELSNLIRIRENILNQFNTGMYFLCIMGIIEVRGGVIKLSDIGIEIAAIMLQAEVQSCKDEDLEIKKIYINPDFSLIIPKNEIPSTALYNILAYTDILKDDVIFHASISKDSITRAFKRGMSLDNFISTLNEFSKNEIPQNLHFLLTEWPKQTIKLTILNATLLNTSHPAFLDELSYGDLKKSIIERISPTYAIIDRKYLDQIIKSTKISNISIKLFEDPQESDQS